METKYDTLKNEYDELRIRHDNAYAKEILAEIGRDKCIEALKDLLKANGMEVDKDSIKYISKAHNKARDLIKSITKSNER